MTEIINITVENIISLELEINLQIGIVSETDLYYYCKFLFIYLIRNRRKDKNGV